MIQGIFCIFLPPNIKVNNYRNENLFLYLRQKQRKLKVLTRFDDIPRTELGEMLPVFREITQLLPALQHLIKLTFKRAHLKTNKCSSKCYKI